MIRLLFVCCLSVVVFRRSLRQQKQLKKLTCIYYRYGIGECVGAKGQFLQRKIAPTFLDTL